MLLLLKNYLIVCSDRKIWDMMLAQGEVTFYRVAVAVFGCIEKELLDKNFDDSLFLIRNCTFKIDAD